MEKRTLGRTGLAVTVLGHGAMEIRGPRIWGGRAVTDDEARTILNAVLDAGINFVDTAWDYGLSEQYIGKYISHRRSEFYLATKCGCSWVDKGDHDETPHVWTRANLLNNIDESLARMRTDHIDVWQLHNPAPDDVAKENLVAVMEEVKKQGKVRHVAISTTVPHIKQYVDSGAFASFQIPYSGLDRTHEEAIQYAADSGAGVIVRGGVAKGAPGGDRSGHKTWRVWDEAKLGELCASGESATAFLLRFTITHPGVHTTIVGTKNPQHLAENIRAAEAGPLSAEVYAEARRRLAVAGKTPVAVR